jgi:mercuric ion transport protein
MTIHLIYSPGCPNVDSARRALRRALDDLHVHATVFEVDFADVETPADLRGWGSPTILVEGADVAGGAPSDDSCRLYGPSEFPGAPPLALIEAALKRVSPVVPPGGLA